MRDTVVGLFAAVVLMTGVPAGAAAAAPAPPPRLDVAAATAALAHQQIHRAPGAIAWFDEDLVRAELTDDIRILVAPFTGRYGKGGNYADGDAHLEQVHRPLRSWAEAQGLTLIKVEGLYASNLDGGAAVPSNIAELRQVTAYLDVTDTVLALVRDAKGMPAEQAFATGYHPDDVVAPTRQQVDELAGTLAESPVHDAPGRADPVADTLAEHSSATFGATVRVAAFPALRRGQPMVDYAPALAERFPDDVILVSYGNWLEVAAPDRLRITSARDFAYGRYQGAARQGVVMTNRMSTVLERYQLLRDDSAFARPLPEPFDLAGEIGELAPWLLLGSSVVLAAASLGPWWFRRPRDRASRLRLAGALTFADITGLGAELLAAEQETGADVSAAWERHTTARRLYEQAHTQEAMAEVREICAQGATILHGVRGGR
ncbi:hypothetical protein [Actinophytocola algeriensis]|uniref:DUF4350 domain-containing protein n=1 Tax=Actinophytocola algeriensis TaxID=1768010 RepID=A0A7W7Q7U8_9PSEU|nr:hypothetical protein [Actinophytocola algeriensis]MBB4908702.1 hypothetical protein [Actinophytocola algeriensis]MBE1474911.1 hypothetical protein [Actinophytocola algeriensis]